MAGTITRMVFSRANPERVNVYLDGRFAFTLDAVEAAKLRIGQQLAPAEVASLTGLGIRQKAYDRAVRFLSSRPHSRSEVELYLQRKRVDDETVADVVGRLEKMGYLDDREFSRFWVENRQRFKPRSRLALRYELQQKGVQRDLVDQATRDLDEAEAAWLAVENKVTHWYNLEPEAFRRRVFDYLRRRGFNYDVITNTYRKACESLSIGTLDE